MNDVINYLRLADPEIIKKNLKRNYFVIKGRINKQDVLLKIAFKDDTEGVKRLYKEKLIGDFIDNGVAEVLDFGQNEQCVWLIRKYYLGFPLASDPDPKAPLFAHKISRKEYRSKRARVAQITNNLAVIRNLNINVNQKLFPKRFEENLAPLENRRIDLIKSELNLNLDKQLKFYNSIKKQYLGKKNVKPCIGDLTPTNIIVTQNDQVIFSDLEWFCFDNYTIDIATLWLFLWRDQDWQKELVKQNIKTKKDNDYFRASIIRIIIHLYDLTTMQIRDTDPERFTERIKKLRKHIWTKYLLAAGNHTKRL